MLVAPALDRLIAADGKVRLVLKELPVLGADSDAVARIAQAAITQGKYFELYEKLIAEPGRATKGKALRLASELGLDGKDRAGRAKSAIEGALAANERLAANLSVRGVPFYLVGDQRIRASGDLYAQLADAVVEIRQNGCRAAC